MLRNVRTVFLGVMVLLAGGSFGPPVVSSQPQPPITYNIIDLGTLGGFSSVALAINENGQVVGSADTPEGKRHAYLWENGVMTDLGRPPGTGLWPSQSEAWGINNLGVVVGTASNTGRIGRSFIWENGQMSELGDPSIPKTAFDINDAGQAVGIFVSINAIDGHAFILEDGVMTDLGTLGGTRSLAWDVNELGQVAGESFTGGSPGGAFLWEDGVMTNLGTLGGGGSNAKGVNDMGSVVGESQRNTGMNELGHATLWEDGETIDLGAIGGWSSSFTQAINNAGQIIGIPSFLYDPDHGMLDLHELLPPGSGWFDLRPRGINDRGQIVGAGFGPNGRHAFLMTPGPWIPAVSDYGVAVLTLLLLIAGTILIGRPRRHTVVKT